MIRTNDGATARVLDERTLEVRDPRGRLLFEYDTKSGRAFFHLPEATLDLSSKDGKIEIGAEQGIRIRSSESIEFVAPRLEARADRIDASAKEVRTAWGRVEQTVGRLFQWAKNVYVRVEELVHTRAGRIRSESATAVQIEGESVRVQAREEVRVDGERIHLG